MAGKAPGADKAREAHLGKLDHEVSMARKVRKDHLEKQVPLVIGDQEVPKAIGVSIQGPPGQQGPIGPWGLRGPKGEKGGSAVPRRNWKQCAWNNLNDNRNYGLIKVRGMDFNEDSKYELVLLLSLPVAEGYTFKVSRRFPLGAQVFLCPTLSPYQPMECCWFSRLMSICVSDWNSFSPLTNK